MVKISTRHIFWRSRLWTASGILFALALALLLALSASAGAGQHRLLAADQFLKATYSPPKLRAPGDPQEIRYDISCLPPDGDADGPDVCDGGGTVYFHSSGNMTASVPLQLDPNAQVGRYVAAIPPTIWNAPWFSYYAVIRDNTTGRTALVPPGGSSAPQFSFGIGAPTVELGDHVFGQTRAATARVASADWGSGEGQVGLESGIDLPAGAASFDVDSSGNVYLLDEANSRLLDFGPGGGAPAQVLLPGLMGVRGDLRLSDSGTAYVLETANASFPEPLLRAYTLQGVQLGSAPLADSAAAQVRVSGSTAYVSEYPSSLWAPVLLNNGRTPVDPSAQLSSGAPGAPVGAGHIVVQSTGSEIRIGTYLLAGTTYQLSAARITSATPVADIQLAQTLPNGRLLVVFSVYTDAQHEYEAVVLDQSGSLVDQFSLPVAEWAQSMPLSRFRLVGSSLYELGSTESGVFVDRYDLGD